MFTPTKEQLEELGFKIFKYSKSIISEYCKNEGSIDIEYEQLGNIWKKGIEPDDGFLHPFYPESIEDIQTLIILLSPNN